MDSTNVDLKSFPTYPSQRKRKRRSRKPSNRKKNCEGEDATCLLGMRLSFDSIYCLRRHYQSLRLRHSTRTRSSSTQTRYWFESRTRSSLGAFSSTRTVFLSRSTRRTMETTSRYQSCSSSSGLASTAFSRVSTTCCWRSSASKLSRSRSSRGTS